MKYLPLYIYSLQLFQLPWGIYITILTLCVLPCISSHGSLKSVELLLSSTRVDLSPLTPDKETLLILAISKVNNFIGLVAI